MGAILKVGFADFKKLADGRRIYYYDTPDYVDLHFLFDGFIIKTTVTREEIDDIKRFFSDKLFYGAVRLDFKIPDFDANSSEFVMSREPAIGVYLDDVQDEETENEDIQREGVDADSEN